MKIAIGLVIIIVSLYSLGFVITLWKEKNKLGATAVFFLAVAIAVVPFFSVLK